MTSHTTSRRSQYVAAKKWLRGEAALIQSKETVMPCMVYPTREEERQSHEAAARREREKGREEMEPLLCSACRALENADYDFGLNPALDQWWHKHKEDDRLREASERREAQRRQFRENAISAALAKPINKLTKTEINLLKQEGILK